METTGSEEEILPESWHLQMVEGPLCLEPLKDTDWFKDENNPVKIEEEMIVVLPGATPDLIQRFKDAEKLYKDRPQGILRLNERMNPFRPNNFTTMFTAAQDIFVPAHQVSELQRAAAEYLGEKAGQVSRNTQKLLDLANYRKEAGALAWVIKEFIDEEKAKPDPRGEVLSDLELMHADIFRDSLFSDDEIVRIYTTGKLASNTLRKLHGKPQIYKDKDEYLEIVTKEMPALDKKLLTTIKHQAEDLYLGK